MQADVAVVILTYNEEANIAHALDSVSGWARQLFVVDSFSTDRTLEVVGRYDCAVVQNAFENYSRQRNFALTQLPIEAEWILFLDADEWVPAELRDEISAVVASRPAENGYFLKYRMIWMEKWIRRGYYPTWILRLFRHGAARCEDRGVGEHLIVDGATGYLRNDFIHHDRKGVDEWIADHNRYATREALEMLRRDGRPGEIDARFWGGTQAQRKRWLRNVVWNRLPPLVRPFMYFFFRYFVQRGFMDGRAGFMFHFLQALWYYFLIDVRYLELKQQKRLAGRAVHLPPENPAAPSRKTPATVNRA
jgi:glycosyltransferase involved in cell wall biosynthesis